MEIVLYESPNTMIELWCFHSALICPRLYEPHLGHSFQILSLLHILHTHSVMSQKIASNKRPVTGTPSTANESMQGCQNHLAGKRWRINNNVRCWPPFWRDWFSVGSFSDLVTGKLLRQVKLLCGRSSRSVSLAQNYCINKRHLGGFFFTIL